VLAFGFLLCSLVSHEYPELVNLTDCPSNDYALLSASSEAQTAVANRHESNHLDVVLIAGPLEVGAPAQSDSSSDFPLDLPPPDVSLRLICVLRT
jgi:hypothetical protein